MHKLTWSLLLIASICLLPAIASAAENDAAKKEEAKKAEVKKPEAAKEPAKEETKEKVEPKKPAPRETTKIEWSELEKKTGELKKPVYKAGQQVKKPEPDIVEFTSEAKAVRISWKTEALEDKKGSMTMAILKERKSPNGKSSSWQNAGRVGVARAGQEGQAVLGLPPGSYKLEIEGGDIKYEVVIEAGTKTTETK
jgi:hypothetical protein